ncbi:hypothetical protein TNCV_1268721 [Trichonephila clavipes]|nr:hypothetical protein TNCV_1268721 [Trichonephila clavipes]
MYKNALKEDFIRVVEDLDGTVESTDNIAKLKTKIEKSSTFEKKQKIELAKLQLAKLEKEVELQTAKNKALNLNPAAKVEEKQFETLNKETATHIGIREAEDWFRPIDLAKECDIYISSKNGSRKETPITYGYTQDPFKNRSQNFKPEIKENYPQNLERENKNCFIYAVIHLSTQETSLSVPSFLYVSDSPLVSMKKEKREVPLRTAYSQAGRLWQPKPSSLRAQAQQIKLKLLDIREERKSEQRKRRRFASRRPRREFMKTHLLPF